MTGGAPGELIFKRPNGEALVACPTAGNMRFVWQAFFDECGSEAMMRGYGWEEAPAALRHGESALVFYRLDATPQVNEWVGWATLLKDVRDPTLQDIALGVRPKFQSQGYRRCILMAASDWAFRENGAEYVSAGVFDDNVDQARKYMGDSGNGFAFRYSGRFWGIGDEAYSYFTRVKPEPGIDERYGLTPGENPAADPSGVIE